AYIEEGARSFLLLRREVAYDITKIVHVSDDSGNPHIKYEAELVLQEEKALDFKNDVEKARKWGEDYYQRWKPELSQEEIQLIEKYTGGGYNEINAYLSDLKKWEVEYGKGSKDKQNLQKTNIQKKIEGIDAAINKTSVPDAMFVYRRVSEWQFGREAGDLRKNTDNTLNATILEEIIKTFSGQTFKQEGYMSTSLAKDPDKSFSGNRYNILLVVHIPKGTHAAYVANMTKYPEQLELLLQRGYTFKYDKFSVIKDEKFQESLRVDISLYNPTS
ncbi:ADP-ribosyltransferase, partial [Bacillus thuringiensis]|nr:ADP-ribosyltransferase [Bacillus thuringiensis]